MARKMYENHEKTTIMLAAKNEKVHDGDKINACKWNVRKWDNNRFSKVSISNNCSKTINNRQLQRGVGYSGRCWSEHLRTNRSEGISVKNNDQNAHFFSVDII